jgi:hypothetical protein
LTSSRPWEGKKVFLLAPNNTMTYIKEIENTLSMIGYEPIIMVYSTQTASESTLVEKFANRFKQVDFVLNESR